MHSNTAHAVTNRFTLHTNVYNYVFVFFILFILICDLLTSEQFKQLDMVERFC